MELVFIDNGQPVTDSLVVAETFGKRHDDVLKSIRELDCSEEFSLRNFSESTYINERGRTYPKFLMTQDGFAFLVMGYTGKEAARFKEMYINEFNRMKQQLALQQFNIPQNYRDALYLAADLEEERARLAELNQQLEQKTLEQQAKIEKDQPLVIFAESVQISQDSILVRDMAKLLRQKGIETGEGRFFEYLRNNGYLIKGGSDYNMPTQRSMDLGIMEVKTGTRNGSNGITRITRTPKITGKGQVYFMNKFLNKLPQVQ